MILWACCCALALSGGLNMGTNINSTAPISAAPASWEYQAIHGEVSGTVELERRAGALQCCAVALLAGFGVGAANYVLEWVGFKLYRALEARGVVRRFVPTGGQFEEHPLSNVWAVGAPYTVLYYIAARFLWHGLSARMIVSFDPLGLWVFLWCGITAG